MLEIIILIIVFAILVIYFCLLRERSFKLFKLYRLKMNPNYPLLPNETIIYLRKDPMRFLLNLPIIPFRMWKIILMKHNDKGLDDAVKKVRNLIVIFYGSGVLLLILLIVLVYKGVL